MKTLRISWIAALAVGLLAIGGGAALAVPLTCDFETGAPGAGECQITTLHNLGAGGVVTVDRTLRIIGPLGELRVNGGATLDLTIAGTAGAAPTTGLIIELGGKITGNTTGTTGVGATLNITVTTGDILLAASGATISAANTAGGGCGSGHGGVININANGLNANITTEDGTTITVNGSTCSAGAININAPNQGSIDIDGDVLAQSNKTGSGTANSNANPPLGGTQQPGGGPIFIDASCDLTISDTGLVSSRGLDPGADLVHLEGGCDVLIDGLVESTGVGHAPPGNPPNSCSNVIPHAGSVRRNPAVRPGKPFNSTACVEVWAGNSLIINKDNAGNNGEINADTGQSPGGSTGTSWIDLFARGDIKVLNSTSTWAVHANGNAGTDNGGVVTVKTTGVNAPPTSPGNIILNGLALQASAAAHGPGGTVDVESFLNVDLRALVGGVDGSIQAKGGNGAPADDGGHIILFAQLNILAGAGSNLNVTGAPTLGGATGVVDLQACGTIDFPPGTITPAGATVNKTPGVCPPAVTLPTEYVVILPDCPCGVTPPPDCEKAAVKSVLNPITGRFPGNLGPDKVVRLDLGDTVQDAVDNATNVKPDPYLIILVVKDGTGTLGGSTTENVDIIKDYSPDRFALVACSVTIKAADAGLPAGHVEQSAASVAGSPENIFVMDLHGANSDVAGWLVEGNGRYFRNVANKNNDTGIAFVGDGNTMHNGNAEGNSAVGIYVEGNGNLVDSSDSFDNGGHGIQVVGDGNTIDGTDVGDRGKGNTGDGINVDGDGNRLLENDVFANLGNGIFAVGDTNLFSKNDVGDAKKGNGLDGINANGAGNSFLENRAYANSGDGFEVSGGTAASPNVFKKNTSGDRGDKSNLGNGFLLDGTGNGNVNPVELEENTAVGNGLNGFKVLGTGYQLKKNVSGGSGTGYPNGACQFDVAAGNINNTGNKSNNVTIPGSNGTAFPTGCK